VRYSANHSIGSIQQLADAEAKAEEASAGGAWIPQVQDCVQQRQLELKFESHGEMRIRLRSFRSPKNKSNRLRRKYGQERQLSVSMLLPSLPFAMREEVLKFPGNPLIQLVDKYCHASVASTATSRLERLKFKRAALSICTNNTLCVTEVPSCVAGLSVLCGWAECHRAARCVVYDGIYMCGWHFELCALSQGTMDKGGSTFFATTCGQESTQGTVDHHFQQGFQQVIDVFTDVSITDVFEWVSPSFLDPQLRPNAIKMLLRVGMMTTPTTPLKKLEDRDVRIDLEDTVRQSTAADGNVSQHNFTDGCGLIAPFLALDMNVEMRCGIEKSQTPISTGLSTPFSASSLLRPEDAEANTYERVCENEPYSSAFQVRWAGMKGLMLCCKDTDDPEHAISFRVSQKKFEPQSTFRLFSDSTYIEWPDDKHHQVLEVMQRIRRVPAAELNASLLSHVAALLYCAGGSDSTNELTKYIHAELLGPCDANVSTIEAPGGGADHAVSARNYDWFKRNYEDGGDAGDVAALNLITTSYFEQQHHPEAFMLTTFRRKLRRLRLVVPKSGWFFGVCDYTNTLKTGEVFLQTPRDVDSGLLPTTGAVVVTNNGPCLDSGSMRALHAVTCDALSHLVDVLVFSSQGEIPEFAHMCGGGDLDGDRYFVCWDPVLTGRTPPTPRTMQSQQSQKTQAENVTFPSMSSWPWSSPKTTHITPRAPVSNDNEMIETLTTQGVSDLLEVGFDIQELLDSCAAEIHRKGDSWMQDSALVDTYASRIYEYIDMPKCCADPGTSRREALCQLPDLLKFKLSQQRYPLAMALGDGALTFANAEQSPDSVVSRAFDEMYNRVFSSICTDGLGSAEVLTTQTQSNAFASACAHLRCYLTQEDPAGASSKANSAEPDSSCQFLGQFMELIAPIGSDRSNTLFNEIVWPADVDVSTVIRQACLAANICLVALNETRNEAMKANDEASKEMKQMWLAAYYAFWTKLNRLVVHGNLKKQITDSTHSLYLMHAQCTIGKISPLSFSDMKNRRENKHFVFIHTSPLPAAVEKSSTDESAGSWRQPFGRLGFPNDDTNCTFRKVDDLKVFLEWQERKHFHWLRYIADPHTGLCFCRGDKIEKASQLLLALCGRSITASAEVPLPFHDCAFDPKTKGHVSIPLSPPFDVASEISLLLEGVLNRINTEVTTILGDASVECASLLWLPKSDSEYGITDCLVLDPIMVLDPIRLRSTSARNIQNPASVGGLNLSRQQSVNKTTSSRRSL
jgi:hypothetical protein